MLPHLTQNSLPTNQTELIYNYLRTLKALKIYKESLLKQIKISM